VAGPVTVEQPLIPTAPKQQQTSQPVSAPNVTSSRLDTVPRVVAAVQQMTTQLNAAEKKKENTGHC
jgi:hypothetical protein